MFLNLLSAIFANHQFVQQLADLSFQTEDIKTAMRNFTQNKGIFTHFDSFTKTKCSNIKLYALHSEI
jgi:hypothetical protein